RVVKDPQRLVLLGLLRGVDCRRSRRSECRIRWAGGGRILLLLRRRVLLRSRLDQHRLRVVDVGHTTDRRNPVRVVVRVVAPAPRRSVAGEGNGCGSQTKPEPESPTISGTPTPAPGAISPGMAPVTVPVAVIPVAVIGRPIAEVCIVTGKLIWMRHVRR